MGNPYADFLKLIPEKKQIVGKVTSVDTPSKTSTLSLLGEGSLKVCGIGVVDKYYLVIDGVIQQELPVLAIYNVTIA